MFVVHCVIYFDFYYYALPLLFTVLPDQPPAPEQQPLQDPPELSPPDLFPPSVREPEQAGRQRARAAVRHSECPETGCTGTLIIFSIAFTCRRRDCLIQ